MGGIRRAVRIANASGFYGDRHTAFAEMVGGGDVDVVTGDYLAEVTMLVLAKGRARDPAAGYAATFPAQIAPVLETVLDRGIKVVVNAGGLDPRGLADRLTAQAHAAGLAPRVAHVAGDDLLGRLGAIQAAGHPLAHAEHGTPLAASGLTPLTANAYLGGWGIARALEAGADIVICGRVSDAALTLGPAAWWHGWARDDFDRLAGAVAAGHVIECGAQATGGNHSSFLGIPGLTHPGFPIAEVAADGSAVITKHPGTGGAVTVGTVTAQLVYEIQGTRYLNPDVTTLLDTLTLRQAGPDRVEIAGTRGAPPPPFAKVAVTALGGYRNEITLVLTGRHIEKKAALAERAVRDGLPGGCSVVFQRIGTAAQDAAGQDAASCLLRIAVKGPQEKAVGRAFSGLVVGLALGNYPGFYATGTPQGARAYGTYWPCAVPVGEVDHHVVLPDGTVEAIPWSPTAPPEPAASFPSAPSPPAAAEGTSFPGAGVVRIPLGEVADARSGDKGGNANLGLWTRDDETYAWLRRTVTVERLRELLPEAAGLPVDRYELPNLRALNFVIHGLLGEGATETSRFDAQAKALGEFVLSRYVEVPIPLASAPATSAG
ncbi:exopolyphosphatase [Sphaerisporangium melleum]|uniref:Exopolyphosphatase n=1 Tax=Sphaerisporangium melleum TaxID=321316 RepID=A0A917VMF7_9ACTN|nr:acyclic terpene utilization AtuA family protein [Sphaerisporangium melleum]GGK96008.1 exopolyphosphatase [Sphaerisporangium melleum]GII70667.1 exopolyphosphatase [Sphaerisporangium melleum]